MSFLPVFIPCRIDVVLTNCQVEDIEALRG